jgi:hypothetical protein
LSDEAAMHHEPIMRFPDHVPNLRRRPACEC